MSRPCCYECLYTVIRRTADITLGDLWGVHLYCLELYGQNRGASLIMCNTEKGVEAFNMARPALTVHELDLEKALKYQSPMRGTIGMNPRREEFMKGLRMFFYQELCRKWATPPSLRLLWLKYVWGNRQKVFVWNVWQNIANMLRRRKEC